MKKLLIIFLALIIQFSIVQAQGVGNMTWQKKYAWEEGATNFAPITIFDANLNQISHYLAVANSNKGQINIYSVSEDGTKVDLVSETAGLPTGKWAIGAYGGRNAYKNTAYLFISYCNTGNAESYLFEDGKIKEKVWNTDRFEKGIDHVSSIGANNDLFLLRSDAGWAWVFETDDETGKLGKILWSVDSWAKGIAGVSSLGRDHLFLTKPNGQSWAFKDNNGPLDFTWGTNEYYKGINVAAASSSTNKSDIAFIANSNEGREWMLKYDPYTKQMNVVWETNWEKGITNQALFGYMKSTLLFLHKPETGTAWLFKVN